MNIVLRLTSYPASNNSRVMRVFGILICLFGMTGLPLLAQQCTVRFDRGQLVFETKGWRLHLNPGEKQFGGLLDDNLIQVIGGIPSPRVGRPQFCRSSLRQTPNRSV